MNIANIHEAELWFAGQPDATITITSKGRSATVTSLRGAIDFLSYEPDDGGPDDGGPDEGCLPGGEPSEGDPSESKPYEGEPIR